LVPGPGDTPTGRRLRLLRILGRVGDDDGRRAGLPGPRISRRRLSVERQVQDLAEGLAHVLRGREALPLARTQEQRFAIRSERDDSSELPASASRRIVPKHPQPIEPRGALRVHKRRSSQSELAAAVLRGLRIGEIDLLVGGKGR
jgi:hypothetical protein